MAGRAEESRLMQGITYNVRIYKTRIYKGVNVITYYVRWKVDGQEWTESFRNTAQAESFRSELVSVARKGEAFSVETGWPASWGRGSYRNRAILARAGMSSRARTRRRSGLMPPPTIGAESPKLSIDATEVLTCPDDGKPENDLLRRALREWTFSALVRTTASNLRADIAPAVHWLERHTVRLADLAGDEGSALARRILDRISQTKDGTPAAANTANRKRMVIGNSMEYAIEIDLLPANPLKASEVDQATGTLTTSRPPRRHKRRASLRRFFAAVEAHSPERGKRMEAVLRLDVPRRSPT